MLAQSSSLVSEHCHSGAQHPSIPPGSSLFYIAYHIVSLLPYPFDPAVKMSRFPPIPEVELSDTQQRAHEGIAQLFSRFPGDFRWKNDEGLVLGPYAPLLCVSSRRLHIIISFSLMYSHSYAEDISDPWYALSLKVMRQERFTAREKELCIFAVLSEYDIPFVHYAHSQIGLWVGFSEDQVQQAVHGDLPDGLGPREAAVYSLAVELAKLRGPLSDESFQQAREVLQRDEVVGVVHIVSGYVYVAMLSNISAAGVPEVREGTFQATKNPKLAGDEVI